MRKLLRVHPLRTGKRFEPVDALVVLPEPLQPRGVRLAFMARAASSARLDMDQRAHLRRNIRFCITLCQKIGYTIRKQRAKAPIFLLRGSFEF